MWENHEGKKKVGRTDSKRDSSMAVLWDSVLEIGLVDKMELSEVEWTVDQLDAELAVEKVEYLEFAKADELVV